MEFAIIKCYIDFEKKLFLLLSFFLIIFIGIARWHDYILSEQIEKMNMVTYEYQHQIELLKIMIQHKNIDVSEDDFDEQDDLKDSDLKDASYDPTLVAGQLSVDSQISNSHFDTEDNLEEQQEDPHKFQFISTEDEKQLKNLRTKSRQEHVLHKKNRKKGGGTSLGTRQIAVLKKQHDPIEVKDFTFHWPLQLHHFWLSSLFGARKKANGKPGFHYGIDLAAMKGTPIKAAAAGTIIQAEYVPGYGNNILIQHNPYYRTRYAHLEKIHARVGQKVAQGQLIGTVGDSGAVRKSGRDASHLHFEIYHNGSHVNPLRYLFN